MVTSEAPRASQSAKWKCRAHHTGRTLVVIYTNATLCGIMVNENSTETTGFYFQWKLLIWIATAFFLILFSFSVLQLLQWNYRTGQLNQQSFLFLNLLTFFILKGKVMKSKDLWKCPLMIWVPYFFFTPQSTNKLLWKKETKEENVKQFKSNNVNIFVRLFFFHQCLKHGCKECCKKVPSCKNRKGQGIFQSFIKDDTPLWVCSTP